MSTASTVRTTTAAAAKATDTRGHGYRVDVCSEVGDRWDKNLTSFRGEEEIAFDARPAVYAGKFQRITNAGGA
jgi:hypothetical protein